MKLKYHLEEIKKFSSSEKFCFLKLKYHLTFLVLLVSFNIFSIILEKLKNLVGKILFSEIKVSF